MHANLRNDESALDECAALMEPIRSAWNDIGDQVNHITR
jgi:flagellin-specific chaperone FliS